MSVITNDASWMGVDLAAQEYILRRCRICGHEDEPISKYNDDLKGWCRACGRPMATRVVMVPHGKVMVWKEEIV